MFVNNLNCLTNAASNGSRQIAAMAKHKAPPKVRSKRDWPLSV